MTAFLLPRSQLIVPDTYNGVSSQSATQLVAAYGAMLKAPTTMMVGAIINGSGPTTFTYLLQWGNTATDSSVMDYQWNGGSPILEMDASNSNSDGPFLEGPANSFAPNVYNDFACTWLGGVNASTDMALYVGAQGAPMALLTGTTPTSGTGIPTGAPGAGENIIIGNRNDSLRTANGSIFYAARWNRVLSLGEMRLAQKFSPLAVPAGLVLYFANGRDWGPYAMPITSQSTVGRGLASANAHLLARTPRRVLFPNVSSGVSFGLTGQSATVTGGTLTPNIAYPLLGQSATVSEGTVIGGTSTALTGQSVTVSEGTITPNIAFQLTGQTATISEGVLIGGNSVALTGQTATVSEGTVTPNIAYQLLGQTATISGGLIQFGIIGNRATISEGTITPEIDFQLAGQTATVSGGAVACGLATGLLGRSVTCAQGALTPGIAYLLAGSSIVVGQGVVGIAGDATVALVGQRITISEGQFVFLFFTVDALRNPLFVNTKVPDITV